LEAAVQEAVCKRRLEHAQDLSTAVLGLASFVVIYIMVFRLTGNRRSQTGVQDALVLGAYGLTILIYVCPSMLTMKNLDIWYSVCMIALTAFHTPFFCTREFMAVANTWTLVLGSIVSFGHFRWQLVMFWNVISMASTWAVQVSDVDDGLTQAMLPRVVLTVWVSIYAGLAAQRRREQARTEIEAQLLKENHSAGNKLLTLFYDLVTELDASLAVAASGRELASFLHSGIGHSLEGSQFVDLLNIEEEQKLFLARTQQSVKEQEALADVLHVTMFLAGHTRQVELFTFQFPSIVGGRRFLVGIRDCGEQQQLQPLQSPGLLCSDDASSCIRQSEETVPESVTIMVNTTLPGLPILGSSSGFEQLVGLTNPAVGLQLAAFVDNANEVEKWVQDMMNFHLSCLPEEEDQEAGCANSCRVVFQPSDNRGTPTSCRHTAQCMILFAHRDEESGEMQDDAISVQLQFSRWRRTRTDRRRVARARARSVGSGSSSSSSSGSISASHGTPRNLERRSLGTVVGI